jgi:diaminopimelate epimerase
VPAIEGVVLFVDDPAAGLVIETAACAPATGPAAMAVSAAAARIDRDSARTRVRLEGGTS